MQNIPANPSLVMRSVRDIAWLRFNNSHSITNWPSSPNVCPSFGRISNHSCVHSFEPSDHRPVHSDDPHGFRTTTNLFSLHSTARRTEYAWFPIRPSTLAPGTPLLVLSRLLNEHPKSRSLLALLNSSSQNRSVSRMSYNLLCLYYVCEG